MATATQPRVQKERSRNSKNVPLSREQEILEEFRRLIDIGIDAMSPGQLEDYERKADEIMKQSRLRSSESASAPGTAESSAAVHLR